jgi:hypothetical protein
MNEDLNLALLQTIARDDRKAVLNLLARGVSVNGRVNDGPTPLDMTVIADRPVSTRKRKMAGPRFTSPHLRDGATWRMC